MQIFDSSQRPSILESAHILEPLQIIWEPSSNQFLIQWSGPESLRFCDDDADADAAGVWTICEVKAETSHPGQGAKLLWAFNSHLCEIPQKIRFPPVAFSITDQLLHEQAGCDQGPVPSSPSVA